MSSPKDYIGLMRKSIGETVEECECGTKPDLFKTGQDLPYGSILTCPECGREYVKIDSDGADLGIITKERYDQLAFSTPEHKGSIFGEIDDECLTCFVSL